MTYIIIGIFAFIGGVCRYGISLALNSGIFPLGTLVVNMVGSFLLALFTSYFLQRFHFKSAISTGITIGFFGAFTTFSSFSVETIKLVNTGHYQLGLLYGLGSATGGVLLAGLGFWLGNRWYHHYLEAHT